MKANQVQSIITSNKEIDIIKDIPYELKLIEINSLEEKKSSFLKISSSFVKNRRINIPVNMYDMSFENEWNLFSKNKTVMDTITKCCTQQHREFNSECFGCICMLIQNQFFFLQLVDKISKKNGKSVEVLSDMLCKFELIGLMQLRRRKRTSLGCL